MGLLHTVAAPQPLYLGDTGGYTRLAKCLRSWAGVLEKRQPAIRAPGVRQATPRVVSLRSVPVILLCAGADIKACWFLRIRGKGPMNRGTKVSRRKLRSRNSWGGLQ